jgi:hypothetical protein
MRPVLLSAGCLAVAASCAHQLKLVAPEAAGEFAVSQLWIAPSDLQARNLFYGPGGASLVPSAGSYELLERDTTGASPGYDVEDAQGRSWSVKLGIEAQSEVVTSRILWALGYHQPVLHFVERWSLTGGEDAESSQPAGRFRLDEPGPEVVGEWSWFENPFVDTQPFRGLIAVNLLLNNWDFKTSNNKIYEGEGQNGASRRYVVRDLGASLGRTSQPWLLRLPGFIRALQGTKNDIEGFEAQGYVRMREDGRIEFDYQGNYGDLVSHVTAGDVRWVCRMLQRLSNEQLADAFRAARYDAAVTARYVKKIRAKIAEGLALPAGPDAD